MHPDYPKRQKFFACKFVRLLIKKTVANELGSQSFALLTVVAMTEDARGYTDPVTFFNEQLAPLVGLGSVDALHRVRSKCLESGWLVYLPGRRTKPGKYWVVIPEKYKGTDDYPTDEGIDDCTINRTGAEQSAESTAIQPRFNRDSSAEPSTYTSSDTFADVPSTRSGAEKAPEKKKTRKPSNKPKAPRKPNLLFDAIIEATSSDQDPKFIQTVCTSLKERNFTPEDVSQFAKCWRALLPWANPDDHPRLTPGIIRKHIQVIREQPVVTKTEPTIKKAADHPSNNGPDLYAPMGGPKK